MKFWPEKADKEFLDASGATTTKTAMLPLDKIVIWNTKPLVGPLPALQQ